MLYLGRSSAAGGLATVLKGRLPIEFFLTLSQYSLALDKTGYLSFPACYCRPVVSSPPMKGGFDGKRGKRRNARQESGGDTGRRKYRRKNRNLHFAIIRYASKLKEN